jgi:hypothetical protein
MSRFTEVPVRPVTPRQPIEYHQKSIGNSVELTTTNRDGKTHSVLGKITDIQHDYGQIVDVKTGECWLAIKILIKPDNGDRAFWTRFADRPTEDNKKPKKRKKTRA